MNSIFNYQKLISKLSQFCIILILASSFHPANATPINASGEALREYYDSFDLEHRWQKGQRIDWFTGASLRPADNTNSTHCSAFVAAALALQHIYMLHPPEHPLKLLANAQADYLQSPKAQQDGWRPLDADFVHAQDMANQGYFTVAVVKNRNRQKPGHSALIYPMNYNEKDIKNNGPYVIQAGYQNGRGLSLIQGFSHHRRDINSLKFYYYHTPYQAAPTPASIVSNKM